jgi:hypothetical protein
MSTPAFSVNAYYENLIELRATKRRQEKRQP